MPLAREGGRAVQGTCEVRSQCAQVGEVAQRGDRLQRPMKEEQDYEKLYDAYYKILIDYNDKLKNNVTKSETQIKN